MPATTDRHRITVAWNVRFDNTCQPLAAPFTWPAFFWRCSGSILKDCRPSVKHGNTNVLIGVDTHKHVMQHASLKEQYQPWKKLFFEIWISVHYTALSLFSIPYLRKRISQSSWLDYCPWNIIRQREDPTGTKTFLLGIAQITLAFLLAHNLGNLFTFSPRENVVFFRVVSDFI